jgi:hypothetical protein
MFIKLLMTNAKANAWWACPFAAMWLQRHWYIERIGRNQLSCMLYPRGYLGTREVGKKKKKRIPWGEALEPALAGRAALKLESGHGPERKIALSISLEKKRRNVVNFDAAMTANEGCGYLMLRHLSSSLCINA